MAFGLYKPGQGYWVRVLAAVMGGLLVLAACAWLWAQVGAITPPYGSWRITLSGAPAGVRPPGIGATVDLLGDPALGPAPIGTGTVAAFEAEGGPSGVLVVKGVKMTDGKYDPTMAQSVRSGDFGARAARPVGVPIVEPLYVQAGAAALLLLAGAALTYWLVGVRPATVEFLIATDGEMKKVNWSSWKDIRGSTLVVIGASVILAAGLFGVDFLFSAFFRAIGVLER